LRIFSDLQAAIRWTVHLDPGPGQQLERAINELARDLHAHGMEVMIHRGPDIGASPGMRRLTPRETKHEKTKSIQYMTEYTPWPRIELDRSLKGGLR